MALFFFFFFQAEDGIRDVAVTGVQTCALPIWRTVPRSVLRLYPGARSKKIKIAGKRRRRMNRLISRKLTILLWLAACLPLIGWDFRKPTPAVTATTAQSPTPSVN